MMRPGIALALTAVLLGAGVIFWMSGTDEGEERRAGVDAPPESARESTLGPDIADAPALAPTTGDAPRTPGVPDAPDAVAPVSAEPTEFFRDKIQQRLNALADAYNAGDAEAAALALDDNHAVIRPDGTTMYASDVLAQWAVEWTQLRDRSLAFEVEFFELDGDELKASWTVDLIATLIGENGESHDFEFNGSQLALYRVDGEDLLLQEPIRYTRVIQLIDGLGVNPHQ